LIDKPEQLTIRQQPGSKSVIHRESFHQQAELAPLVGK